MKCDLLADFEEWVKKQLDTLLIDHSRISDRDELCKLYLAVTRKLPKSKSRKVHTPHGFNCPATVSAGLAQLKAKMKKGENLRPHMSRGVKKLWIGDGLLDAWDIHHFHLGLKLENDGFIERTGPLLYARVLEDDVYCIDVKEHGAWCRQDFVDIVDQNWSDTIAKWIAQGATETAFDPTDGDVKALRKKQLNTFIKTSSGRIYAPMGLGVASGLQNTSGSSSATSFNVRDTIQWNRIKRTLSSAQSQIDDDPSLVTKLEQQAQSCGKSLCEPPSLRLHLQDGPLVIVQEECSECLVSIDVGEQE